MSTSSEVPNGFGDGDRHGWMDRICTHLAAVLTGRAAARVLEEELPPSAGLAVLPTWTWTSPAIDVGAKARARDGGRLRLPVRICWLPSPVQLVPHGEEVEATWTGSGLGNHGTGTCVLGVSYGSAADEQDADRVDDSRVPGSFDAPLLYRSELRARLTDLVEAGRMAQWEIISDLEPYVRSAVTSAAATAANELRGSGWSNGSSLDELSLDALTDELLLGTEHNPGPVHRLVERALVPTAFARVDPQRWFRVALSRDADQALRRRIEDPWVGRRIRAVARDLDTDDVHEVIEAYNTRHPADRVAEHRVAAALNATADLILQEAPLIRAGRSTWVDSHEDDVIEAVDKLRARSALPDRIVARTAVPSAHRG